MNETFWKEFYTKPHTMEPTAFVRWCGIQGKRVIDFGCGNGRDTVYLAEKNNVIGVDMFAPENPLLFCCPIERLLKVDPEADVAYCRFLFHAIEAQTEELIVNWASRHKAVLYVEARSIYDKPNPDHERRLMDGNAFVHGLLEAGFRVTHYQEGHGLAVFNEEDPHVIRVVAQGKG